MPDQGAISCAEAAAGFDLIETMGFDPLTGIPHLELHLERMKASAAELGFAFDRHAARNQIQALCFELDQPAKLRLLLVARRGDHARNLGRCPRAPDGPVDCALVPLPVVVGDWRLRHKSTDRAFYEMALELAKDEGATRSAADPRRRAGHRRRDHQPVRRDATACC